MDINDKNSLTTWIIRFYRNERISNFIIFCFGVIGAITLIILFKIRHGNLSFGLLLNGFPLSLFCILMGLKGYIVTINRIKGIALNNYNISQNILKDELAYWQNKVDANPLKVRSYSFFTGIGIIGSASAVFFHTSHYFLSTMVCFAIYSSVLLIYTLLRFFQIDDYCRRINKFIY